MEYNFSVQSLLRANLEILFSSRELEVFAGQVFSTGEINLCYIFKWHKSLTVNNVCPKGNYVSDYIG